MIRPNMATMLGFVATDANIEKSLLQNILTDTVNQSFNRITVDGDTSTNDCCTLIATGQVGKVIDSENHPHYQAIYEAINNVMIRIAQLIGRPVLNLQVQPRDDSGGGTRLCHQQRVQ
jgi:glutamate N-acetyltransferase/amino-acid N-acetyltransferase